MTKKKYDTIIGDKVTTTDEVWFKCGHSNVFVRPTPVWWGYCKRCEQWREVR